MRWKLLVNFGFKKEYFNGRLIVSLGGNIDYNNPYILQARNTNVLLTPDITVEYILTADGKLRVVGFNRTSVDALSQRNRTGVRLSYQKSLIKTKHQSKEKRKKAGYKNKALISHLKYYAPACPFLVCKYFSLCGFDFISMGTLSTTSKPYPKRPARLRGLLLISLILLTPICLSIWAPTP